MAAFTTIDNPELFYQTELFTGNASTGHAQTLDGSEDMQPDMVWFKNRDSTDVPSIYDAVRGATKRLVVTSTAVESDQVNGLQSFNSDGFTVGGNAECNETGEKIVAWCWKAGTTSGLSGGSITPDAYSFNTTSGFSIVKFEGNGTVGATVAHGLGAVPKAIIIKGTDLYANNWQVYHVGAGNLGNLVLNNDDAFADDDSRWNDTTPTSTVWTMGSGATVNYNGRTFVAYVWADVQGFSKCGSYEGNANTDGTFIYTGFRPALVIIKNIDGSSMGWTIRGKGLNPFNPADGHIVANTTAAEASGKDIDILSNGFKARTTDGGVNGSGNTHVYMAFAEQPFVNSNGVPCNAR